MTRSDPELAYYVEDDEDDYPHDLELDNYS